MSENDDNVGAHQSSTTPVLSGISQARPSAGKHLQKYAPALAGTGGMYATSPVKPQLHAFELSGDA